MRKRHEIANPDSCLNKAREDELMFVLLARDIAAPQIIRAWCNERIRLGKNKEYGDPQIAEARALADLMVEERKRSALNEPARS